MADSDFKNTYCDQHKDEKVTLYCKGCRQLVCNECICSQHDGHHFSLIATVANELRKSLPATIEKTQTGYLSELQKKKEDINLLKGDSEKSMDLLMDNINQRTEEFKIELDKIRDILLEEIQTLREKDRKALKNAEEQINDNLDKLQTSLKSCREGIESEFDIQIIKLSMGLDYALNVIKNMTLEVPKIRVPQFLPGHLQGSLLQGLFGKIVDEELHDAEHASDIDISPDEIIERKLNILSFFQFVDDSSIRCISSDGNGAWIASHSNTNIHLVTKNGELKKTLDLDVKVYNLSITSDGCLLIVPNRANQIWKIDSNGECSDFVNLEPFYPLGLFVSSSGDIYTGLVDGRPYKVNNNNTRAVLKLSSSGLVQKRFEFDEVHDHLFIRPQRIVENEQKDIIVLDRTSHREGRIISIRQTGEKRFVYHGHQCKAMQNKFHPGDLCCIDSNNLVVSDGNNHILHVLNFDGHLVHYLNPKLEGLPPAISALAYDSKGCLILGSSKGTVYVLRYLD